MVVESVKTEPIKEKMPAAIFVIWLVFNNTLDSPGCLKFM